MASMTPRLVETEDHMIYVISVPPHVSWQDLVVQMPRHVHVTLRVGNATTTMAKIPINLNVTQHMRLVPKARFYPKPRLLMILVKKDAVAAKHGHDVPNNL